MILSFCKYNFPANYIFLFVFTVAMSLELGFICAIFEDLGFGFMILQAAAITAVIFLGLTLYALCSGKSFSYMGGFLYTMLWGLIVVGFAAIFLPWLRDSLLLGFVGAATF